MYAPTEEKQHYVTALAILRLLKTEYWQCLQNFW